TLAAPGLAQEGDEGPTWEILRAWGGLIRMPGWMEAQVTLTNEGSAWEGALQISDPANEVDYRLPLLLPAHSRKQYRLPLFVSGRGALRIALVQEGQDEHQKMLRHIPVENTERVCVIVDASGVLPLGASEGCAHFFLLQEVEGLPETPMAWDAVDVLLVNGTSTAALTAAQRDALLAWVGAGGHLIVGGGAALPQALAGLPETLQIASLSAPGASTLRPAPGAEITSRSLQGAVVVGKELGVGRVEVVGWDLANSQYLLRFTSLWAGDAIPAVSLLSSGGALASAAPNHNTLLEVPTSLMPKLWPWLIVFPLYVLLMGPGTWLIVKRRRRPLLVWVLIPLWIALATMGLSLWLGGAFAHTFPMVNEIALVSVPAPGLPARVVQSTAFFAPRAGALHWEMEGAPRPLLGRFDFDMGYYSEGQSFPADVLWTETGARVDTEHPLGPLTWGTEGLTTAPEITADLAWASGWNGGGGHPLIQGTLRSSVPLQYLNLLLEGGDYRIALTDTVLANVQLEITQPVTVEQTHSLTYNELCGVRSHDYYYPYYVTPPSIHSHPEEQDARAHRCYLTAITTGVPFSHEKLRGTWMGETCWLVAVPCPTFYSGSVHISSENFSVSAENGWADEDGYVYVSAPDTTVDYTLPSFLAPWKVNRLTLEMQQADYDYMSPGSAAPLHTILTLDLWDWEGRDWVAYSLPQDGKTLVLEGEEAQRFVSLTEGVSLRLTPIAEDVPIVQVLITIDGTR
ncbi:MAG: hypothetical protein U9R05_04995, partial [Chloroflexota bacterium]|nr:hypothetical protein [Chloroflexota bacterium]